MCLRRWGQCHLLELALEKSNWCHICCTAVLSHYKMWEVLITLPTCLAYYPSQLSKELVNIRLDSQPTFLLFSNSSNVILPKDFSLTIFFLCSPKNWKIIFAINTPISQILRIRHILAKYLTKDYAVISYRTKYNSVFFLNFILLLSHSFSPFQIYLRQDWRKYISRYQQYSPSLFFSVPVLGFTLGLLSEVKFQCQLCTWSVPILFRIRLLSQRW